MFSKARKKKSVGTNSSTLECSIPCSSACRARVRAFINLQMCFKLVYDIMCWDTSVCMCWCVRVFKRAFKHRAFAHFLFKHSYEHSLEHVLFEYSLRSNMGGLTGRERRAGDRETERRNERE
eukprot:1392910-Amorphochlora_amoeboformis.AAC.1